MTKTEVYSWRLGPELKQRLEERARREGLSLAALLQRITRDWLDEHGDVGDQREQRARHEAAAACFGQLAGGDPARSRQTRERLREKLSDRRRAR